MPERKIRLRRQWPLAKPVTLKTEDGDVDDDVDDDSGYENGDVDGVDDECSQV